MKKEKKIRTARKNDVVNIVNEEKLLEQDEDVELTANMSKNEISFSSITIATSKIVSASRT